MPISVGSNCSDQRLYAQDASLERWPGRTANRRVDVAIVGAGPAGSYFAFRLAHAQPGKRIVLFEMRDRPGGRLQSIAANGGALELGGMFVGDNHENVLGLIDRFGLEKRPVSLRRMNYFLRGHSFTDDAFADARAVPYRLEDTEQGRGPPELMLEAVSRIAPGIETQWPFAENGQNASMARTAEFLHGLKADGRRLWDWSLLHLLESKMSNEACACLCDTLGSTSALRGNALECLLTLLREGDPAQHHYVLAGGFQQLPEALARTACEAGAEFSPRRQLVRITTLTDGFRLHFEGGDGGDRVEADSVVLALPKRAIERIEMDEALAGDQFRLDLDAVSSVPACKLALGFKTAWWRDPSPRADERNEREVLASYTDGRFRMFYYNEPANGEYAFVTAYADGAAAESWLDADDPAYRDTAARPWFGGDDGMFRPSGATVEAARRCLERLHPGVTVPAPCGAAFCDWTKQGGWHVWNAHVRPWRIRRRMRRPNPNLRFFTCGEAFAQFSGWTEGALNQAEILLEEHFNLPRPDWVGAGYRFEV
jgi:monoamine oxidase